MSDLVLVYTLFADAGEARRLSRLLVGEGLAACANMLGPCTSIYEWQGDVREENEFPVLLKTVVEKSAALMARLGELPSYAVPAVFLWEDMANGSYVDRSDERRGGNECVSTCSDRG